MQDETVNRTAQEMAYCEAILAKSKTSVLLKTLPATGVSTWQHYPEPEVFDPASGAQWYYHCHDDSEALGEHGHFHCFVRPDGPQSPACHLIALGVTAKGKLTRLFTVNRWVVGGQWYSAEETNALIDDFNVEMANPDYLVNRWLTAALSRYQKDIVSLNLERDAKIAALRLEKQCEDEVLFEDRTIEVLSELHLK